MIHVSKIMDPALLESMVNDRFITKRENPWIPGMFIYSYADKAVFSREWNDATMNCRGLILDADENIVARPWKKFFNFGEKRTLIDSRTNVEVTDKMDGSLGIVASYFDPSTCITDLIFSTRGSFESEQAEHMREVWHEKYLGLHVPQGYTFLFEIVYPENRIVLDYKGLDDLVLLGAVDTDQGFYYGPNEAAGLLVWPGPVTEVLGNGPLGDWMSLHRQNKEGVVCRSGQHMIKLKQEDYVELHRIISNLSPRSVWEALKAGKTPSDICDDLPDEFHEFVRTTATTMILTWLTMQTEAMEHFIGAKEAYVLSGQRKDFALKATKSPWKGVLFAWFDKKEKVAEEALWDAVWAHHRPSHGEPA